jgi:predicted nucleic acid-binding protein
MRTMVQPPRVYLDTSVYNRPFDDLTIPRNRVEAEATLAIIGLAESEGVRLIHSYVLVREAFRSPYLQRRDEVMKLQRLATIYVRARPSIPLLAAQLTHEHGFKALDALHVVCAQQARADYFVSVDDRLNRKVARLMGSMKAVTPPELIAMVADALAP